MNKIAFTSVYDDLLSILYPANSLFYQFPRDFECPILKSNVYDIFFNNEKDYFSFPESYTDFSELENFILIVPDNDDEDCRFVVPIYVNFLSNYEKSGYEAKIFTYSVFDHYKKHFEKIQDYLLYRKIEKVDVRFAWFPFGYVTSNPFHVDCKRDSLYNKVKEGFVFIENGLNGKYNKLPTGWIEFLNAFLEHKQIAVYSGDDVMPNFLIDEDFSKFGSTIFTTLEYSVLITQEFDHGSWYLWYTKNTYYLAKELGARLEDCFNQSWFVKKLSRIISPSIIPLAETNIFYESVDRFIRIEIVKSLDSVSGEKKAKGEKTAKTAKTRQTKN
ncbi:MAG: hypothetical protein N3A54_01140 [Patescibacteria group bacterium]|nr:hypothetical protein [Patescibacteria group bacterium]